MGFLDNLKSKSQQMSQQLNTKKSQLKSREFAQGSMAICALVAAADGSIDPVEQQKTTDVITTNEVLSIFDPRDLREIFDKYAGKLRTDYQLGKVEAIQAIGKLRGKPEQARAAIQIGIIIGGADGNFDENEQAAVREACNAVGIAPGEFDL
jgi:tellurite resistance protein TerB